MWKPASGTEELVHHFGLEDAFELLTRLLVGKIGLKELTISPHREVICFISNRDTTTFFQGESSELICQDQIQACEFVTPEVVEAKDATRDDFRWEWDDSRSDARTLVAS